MAASNLDAQLSAAVASASASASDCNDMPYDKVVIHLARAPSRVFEKGGVFYVLEYPVTPAQEAEIRRIAHGHAQCNACTSRALEYARLAGPGGALFLEHADDAADREFAQLRALAAEICSNRDAVPVPVIVGSSTFARLQEGSDSVTGKPWCHWTVCPSNVTQNAKLYKLAVQTYVRTSAAGPQMLTALVARILESPEMVESMRLFSECLDKAHRGAIYRGCTDWLLGIQAKADGQIWSRMSAVEKVHIVMFALSTARVSRGSATITMYHQANNSVMGFLENAHDEKAMVGLINAQSDPHAYQRRTAPPSSGQIQAAMDKIGPDYKNMVVLRSELGKFYPDQVIVWANPAEDAAHASGSGFEAMMRDQAAAGSAGTTSTKRGRARGFASRAARARGITTVGELKAILSDGKVHKLYVDAADHSPWVVAHSTQPDILRDCQDHSWACWSSDRLSSGWSGTRRMLVKTVFKMPMGELLFVCEGATLKSNLGNFCFPEFLRPEYHDCKQAFEDLNRRTTVEVPDCPAGDQYAVGMCAYPTTASRRLGKAVTIWLDGQEHTLTSME
jgi:hypothetical protein